MAGSSSHWGNRLGLGHPKARVLAKDPLQYGYGVSARSSWALGPELFPRSALCYGVEVPEVIKDLCWRASYIGQEKIW